MRAALFALIFAACGGKPSLLDHDAPAAKDPWAAASLPTTDDKGGFDFQGMLSKIKDSIEKPGFYEAPEQSADYQADKPHWGVMKLEGELVEREAFSFTGGKGTELRTVVDRLRELEKDPLLQGVILRVGTITASIPDIVELRAVMLELRAAKKRLVCHAENASNGTYLVLAACDKLAIAPLGDIAITGPTAMPIHLKGLLDKLGVQADFIHVGAYKGAAEPLTRDAPSKEMEEVLGAILDQRYATMVDIIAQDRHLDPAAVKGLIDTGLFPAEQAQQAKLVDEITSFEMLRDEQKAPWTKLELEPEHRDQLASYLKLARFIGAMPPDRPGADHIAVVYAVGNIIDGAGEGLLGARHEIASHTLVSALHALAADPAVKAVVLRIDSGGGSAQASELIWAAVADLKSKKPVIVSMSDVAASGGYYIASGATKIFALDDTLTGSIGVIGGKIAPGPALAKLGITTFPMGRGKHATMMASFQPWTAEEKATIETTMKAVYGTFKSRVAAGRHKTPEEIEPIAQGHVWTGAKAKELGLVDEIGGLDAAIGEAQKLAKLDGTTDIEVYPPAPTLRDVLHGWGGPSMPFGLHAELADLLDPALAAQAEKLLALARTFATTHVQTLAFLPELPMKTSIVLLALAACGSNNASSTAAPPASTSTSVPAGERGKVVERTFHSNALGVDKHYLVYLPFGYDAKPTTKWPVFYYLHGLGGDEKSWIKGGHLDEAADKLGLQALIVMPDGDDGFYIDSQKTTDYDACIKNGTGLLMPTEQDPATQCVKHFAYETYIVKELLADVDAHYHTNATREGRGIAGLSMGGLGAWELGLRYPTVFAAAASHSGYIALRYKGPHPYEAGKVSLSSLSEGPSGNPLIDWVRSVFGGDLTNWDMHDPSQLINTMTPGHPELYLDCGTEDEFKFNDAAQYVHDTLNARHIQHAFFIGPGHHDFAFWIPREVESLKWLQEHVAKP